QLFHVAYVLIKFANSPRPDLWVLERSTDLGLTYSPWQYFASSKRDCIERFGARSIERIFKDDDVICTTEYSRIVPLENGEIVVSLVNGRPGAMNFSYSPVLQDFTKATNIRLRFLRTNTLLGHLMGKALRDPTVTRRYYYSIKDISIGGRCVCNGHADVCGAKDPSDPYRLQCDCQHNTCGGSCDHCCPGFNQLPWKPATTASANECEPCNCNGHAFDCYYDPEVDQHRASVDRRDQNRGGGVCMECQHHTTGINCERCVPGYYRSPLHPVESALACSACSCASEFMDGTCEDLTGRCYCKPNYTGPNCGACAEGYVNFPQCYHYLLCTGSFRPPNLIHCECSPTGTRGNSCRPDPVSRVCICKPNFEGTHCDQCSFGFYGLNCQPCQCSGPGVLDGSCDVDSGQCLCRSGFEGHFCGQCAPGYFNYPLCQLCGCSGVGTLPEGCDLAGRCLCKPMFTGPRCDQCSHGFHSYPNCQVLSCDIKVKLDGVYFSKIQAGSALGVGNPALKRAAPPKKQMKSWVTCHCSIEGSRHSTCDQETGQCNCLPNVAAQRCNTCLPGAYGFPLCQEATCFIFGGFLSLLFSYLGSCECRPYVEGLACDRCKPLYWNLTPDNPYGCSTCHCGTEGTLSGVAECLQGNGQCFCKPNICSRTCSVCKDGYFGLDDGKYFGCQGCQCDIGGSVGLTCDERAGRCHCRQNVEGDKCNQPKREHYFPDLHHLKFEIEEGTTPDGRPVRFGYNPLEFENFSWKGYAQMSTIQPEVVVTVNVTSPDLFLIVFRYVNRESANVEGRVSILEEGRLDVCGNCSEQSKQIIFAPSTEPTFVTVPQNSFGEPFVLNPSTWSVTIEAQGILLDYLVLLPSAYYEAPILQLKVTEACVYSPSPEQTKQNCLLYQYLSVDGFPSSQGADGICRFDNTVPRPCQTEQITLRHPPMAVCSGNNINVQMTLAVPRPGGYVLLVEYVNEDESTQTVNVIVNTPGRESQQGTLTLYTCKYSYLCCRVIFVNALNENLVFLIKCSNIPICFFFQYKVHLIPWEQFSMEYAEPKVHCISVHGTFSPSRGACIPSRFQKPSQSIVLKGGQTASIPSTLPLIYESQLTPADQPNEPQKPRPRPPTAVDSGDLILLQSPRTVVIYNSRIQTLGPYAFILHYYQPNHPAFPVEVLINGGRIWQGSANATFCPHGYGCRSLVISENQIILDVTDHNLSVTIRVPEGKTLWLDYVLVVPEESYNSNYLNEEPLDKSYKFISSCGISSFYINSKASSFCRDSAISLSVFYNNGAQPCTCHEAGALSSSCEAFGGQCSCKPNVIGRSCSRCATGYWGFPNCRTCNCGARLCSEVTGQCICPPHTVKPECMVCEPLTFGCHPLIGCERCNCSRTGVQELTDPECDRENGQCKCKPNVSGRRCDQCTRGFYNYPNCKRCDCNEAGTQADICHPVTGQCHCKENVEGVRCDQCRLGTFHLDPANPKGCTSCFCFGATDRCRSSEKFRTEFIDMTGWVLLNGDRQEMEVSFQPEEKLVTANLKDIFPDNQEMYWRAPRPYLGDRVSSYGGFLRYQLNSEAMRGDLFPVPVEARPDVILKGNQMTIMYLEKVYPNVGEQHHGRVQLLEGDFRHAQTHNPVSREELMMVLANLQELQIRALHSQSAKSVSLGRVSLEVATDTAMGVSTSYVEICMCPANYRGDSCQYWAAFVYLFLWVLFLVKSIMLTCQCYKVGAAAFCFNCQHHTAGDHCERCRNGFVGNLIRGEPLTCSGCPCPLQVASNNFALGCVDRGSTMQCLCKPGYAGSKCERCAPGYYGNPMVIGSSCQPCDCNGNTDSNMLFSHCDALTGVCIGCMHNTAGPHCEICAPGYYGDAVLAKNCSNCDCSPCGTESCDHRTGLCLCKPGVTGVRCDRCEDGYYGYDRCAGCQKCDCDIAALSPTCHTQNGQCLCQPGVNGARCQQCAPGYWAYGANGCTKCNCKGGSCNPRTGECTCSDGLAGKQCDTCIQKYEILLSNGADSTNKPCNRRIVIFGGGGTQTRECLHTYTEGSRVNTRDKKKQTKIRLLTAVVVGVEDELLRYQNSLDSAKQNTDELENESMNLIQDLDVLEEKVTMANRKADKLGEATQETFQQAEDLLNRAMGITNSIFDIMEQMNRTASANSSTPSSEEYRQKLAEVEKMLNEMKARAFGDQTRRAKGEQQAARKLLERVKEEMESRLEENHRLALDIKDQLTQFSSELMDLRDLLNEAVNKTGRADELNSINQIVLEEFKQKIDDIQDQVRQVEDLLKMAEDALVQVYDILQMLNNAIEEYEKLAANLDGAKAPLMDKVKKFSPARTKTPIVEQAEEHARLLDQLAKNLSSIIEDTNQDGFIQRAINASNAYSGIIEAVKSAEKAANEAAAAADDALKNVRSEDLAGKAERLKKKSNKLEEEAKAAQKNLTTEVKPALQEAKKNLRDVKSKKEELFTGLRSVQNKLIMDRDDVLDNINNAKMTAQEANTTASDVEETVTTMKKNLDEWKEKYGGTPSEDFTKVFQEAKTSVTALEKTIPELLEKLNKIESQTSQSSNISNNILRIRQLISQARNAASKVKVPMKFNGNSGVQLRNPRNLQDLAAYTSLKFHIRTVGATKKKRQVAADAKRFVLYLGNQDNLVKCSHSLSLRRSGKVKPVFLCPTTSRSSLRSSDVILFFFSLTFLFRSSLFFSTRKTNLDRVTVFTEVTQDKRLLSPSYYLGGLPADKMPASPLLLCYSPDLKNSFGQECNYSLVLFKLLLFERLLADNLPNCSAGSISNVFDTKMWLLPCNFFFQGSGLKNRILRSRPMPRQHDGLARRILQEALAFLSFYVVPLFYVLLVEYLFLYLIKENSIKTKFKEKKKKNPSMAKEVPYARLSTTSSVRAALHFTVLIARSTAKLFFSFSLRKLFPNGGSLKGCMRNIKALDKYIDLKRANTTGVSYGCSADLLVARSVRFHGDGYLRLPVENVPSLDNDFYSGFGFRTNQKSGLLFHYSATVCLQFSTLCISFTRRAKAMADRIQSPYNHVMVFEPRTVAPQMVVDLQQNVENYNVTLSCSNEKGPQQMRALPKRDRKKSKINTLDQYFLFSAQQDQLFKPEYTLLSKVLDFSIPRTPPRLQLLPKAALMGRRRRVERSCQLFNQPKAFNGAYQFGGFSFSHLEYESVPESLKERSHFSMEVQLNSSNGLLFYVSDDLEKSYMALFVANGRFIFLIHINGAKLKLRVREKYNDSQWHTIFFSRDQNKASLVIDGLKAQTGTLLKTDDFIARNPFYVGGVPADKDASLRSFRGCMKNLKLDGEPLEPPTRVYGVIPCFQGSLEPGVYFSANGGYVTQDNSFVIGRDFELMLEVRPQSPSGLVFHAGRKGHYVTLYTENGKATVKVNTGAGGISASVTPRQSLCDGQWHAIAVIKRKNVIQLDVDTEGNYTVGPSHAHSAGNEELLYVGGVPDTVEIPVVPPPSSYIGCIRNVIINQNPTDLFRTKSVHGAVGLQGCPVI
uniref:Laminin subunit alpha 5 n=1 Tax=Latimeria chalumnae TaxID=7897 RepID=H3AL54_LATCH